MKHYLTIVLLFVAAAAFGQKSITSGDIEGWTTANLPSAEAYLPSSGYNLGIPAVATTRIKDTLNWDEVQTLSFDQSRRVLSYADGVITTTEDGRLVAGNGISFYNDDGSVTLSTRPVGRDSVYSTYDTVVLNAGKVKCLHEWVDKRNYGQYSGAYGMVCAVYHGQTGCPDTWLDKERICSQCLRYEHIKESRSVIRLVPPVSFEELKARIK